METISKLPWLWIVLRHRDKDLWMIYGFVGKSSEDIQEVIDMK